MSSEFQQQGYAPSLQQQGDELTYPSFLITPLKEWRPRNNFAVASLGPCDISQMCELNALVRETLPENAKNRLKPVTAGQLSAHFKESNRAFGCFSDRGVLVASFMMTSLGNPASGVIDFPDHTLAPGWMAIQRLGVHPEYRGREYALAARLLQRARFETLTNPDAQNLVAKVDAGNKPSINTFLNAGFRLVSAGSGVPQRDAAQGYPVVYLSLEADKALAQEGRNTVNSQNGFAPSRR